MIYVNVIKSFSELFQVEFFKAYCLPQVCQGILITEDCSLCEVFGGTFDCFLVPQVITYFLYKLQPIFVLLSFRKVYFLLHLIKLCYYI